MSSFADLGVCVLFLCLCQNEHRGQLEDSKCFHEYGDWIWTMASCSNLHLPDNLYKEVPVPIPTSTVKVPDESALDGIWYKFARILVEILLVKYGIY